MALKDVKVAPDVYFAGTVQEEVGLRGAKTVGQMVEPDISIALDVYPCNDTTNDPKGEYALGKGCTICLADTSSIAHTGLVQYLEELCEKHGIAYQETMISRGGTDSGELHRVGKGSVNVSIAIPNRYVHTQRSIINRQDYQSALSLLVEFLKDINLEKLQALLASKQ